MTEGRAVPAGKPVPVVNAANALTVTRIVLVPVFVLFTVIGETTHAGWQLAAGVAFVVASITDYVDGWIARTHNLVTSFGKVADPIADKALTGSALVLLSLYEQVSWWVTGLILVREWGVTALRFWVLRHGVIPASRGGKVKTMLQILAIGWYLFPLPGTLATLGPWLMGAAVVVTVVTGADYVLRAYRMRRDAQTGAATRAIPGAPAGGLPAVADIEAPLATGPVVPEREGESGGDDDGLLLPAPAPAVGPTPAVAPPADKTVA